MVNRADGTVYGVSRIFSMFFHVPMTIGGGKFSITLKMEFFKPKLHAVQIPSEIGAASAKLFEPGL